MSFHRGVVIMALSAMLCSACSKSDEKKAEAKQDAVTASVPAPAPAAPPVETIPAIANGHIIPAEEVERAAQAQREQDLELKAAAAEVRARFAEMELQQQTANQLAQQQQAARDEAARAAALSDQNAMLRAQALLNEQRAVEAEQAAYGLQGNVVVVQPALRGLPRTSEPTLPSYPGQRPSPGMHNGTGLNQPAVPDLTPPGPIAPLVPFQKPPGVRQAADPANRR